MITKSEAEVKAIITNKRRKYVFCPLIKKECQVDCECYAPAKAVEDHEAERYYVGGGYCSAYALKGRKLYD